MTGVTEQLVTVDGVELCLETFGDPADPTLLLIGGAAASMVWWDPAFCRRLAEPGRFVIRYDHRDTGRSSAWPAGEPGYTGTDLALDAIRVLDALDVVRAHLFGISMGGAIAQWLAARQPDRVETLTLVATGAAGQRADQTPLPPPEPRVADTFEHPAPAPDWGDREAVVRHHVEGYRPYAGDLGYDATLTRARVEAEHDRSRDPEAAATNHWLVVGADADDEPFRLADLRAPTLVLHGTTDPLFPYAHGEALAAEIPGATLLPLVGMGHEVPPPALWDTVVAAVTAHTAAR